MHAASHSSASSLPSPSTSKVDDAPRKWIFAKTRVRSRERAHGDADGGVGVIARRVLAQGLEVRLLNRAHLGAGRELPASLGEDPQHAALLLGKPRLRFVVGS